MAGETPLSAEAFAAALNVSRETCARLAVYEARLRHWQRRVNLVATATLDDIWRRHFLDSAQLFALMGPARPRLADIGTGAGFPGMVLAIMGWPEVVLIEANSRKCAFLAEVARATETKVDIRQGRAETLAPVAAGIVTARACAPLPRLLPLAHRHLADDGVAWLMKGRAVERELTGIAKNWTMTVERHPSQSDGSGVILALRGLQTNRDAHVQN